MTLAEPISAAWCVYTTAGPCTVNGHVSGSPPAPGLCKYQVANEQCVDVSGRCYACTSTEESSSLRASTSLRVKTSLCTRATILKDEETDGKVTCRYVKVI